MAALGLAAVIAAAWWVRAPGVAVTTVNAQMLVRTLQFTGRVKTPARVDVGVTLTGRVQQVRVREGDVVAQGDALIELEADEWRAAWQQAQAGWQQAQARLGSVQALALPSAEAALAQAEATVQQAERDLARTRELVAQQFYSQARLDEAQRSVAVARAQRDAARVQVQANRPQGAERAGSLAQLAAAKAAVEVARARLEQATVRAPGPGRVLVRSVEPGQIVQAGKSLLTLSVDGPTELVAQVDERYLGQLQVGQRAAVLADAYPGQPFEAVVDRLAPAVNAQSGAVEVTLRVQGERLAFLREDMTLSIEVITAREASVLALPLRAVREAVEGAQPTPANEGRATVLVFAEGRAQLREVTLGLRTLDQVAVRSGLRSGDQVLLDPTVAPGARVRALAAADSVTQGKAPGGVSRDRAEGGISQTFSR
jgi:HlyD family secretion protein